MSMVINPFWGTAAPSANVRGSRLFWIDNTNTGTLLLPDSSSAGDLMYLFCSHGWSASAPSGWTTENNMAGLFYNGAIFSKILSSGDITTGSVTVGFAGSEWGFMVGVSLIGPKGGTRTVSATRNSGNDSTRTVTTDSSPISGDIALYFGGFRSNASNSVTCDRGDTLETFTGVVSGIGSAVLTDEILMSSGAQTAIFTHESSFYSGDYQAIVVVAP